jgi:hypothetical protein
MAFEPDILVQTPDGATLVIEVKPSNSEREASQLKRYMAAMRIPLGMLVSPKSIEVFRDTYAGTDEDSIKVLGTFGTEGLFSFGPQAVPVDDSESGAKAFAFEIAVQRWLESLLNEAAVAHLPSAMRAAFEREILPTLREGQIRAAGPRWRHTGS